MKVQQLEDLKKTINEYMSNTDPESVSDDLKGIQKTYEKHRKKGYLQALKDVVSIINNLS